MIADEVMTGFGRTGAMFATQHAQVSPDLMCLSKGITGGVLPLAATLATEAIYEDFLAPQTTRAFLHGHSYTGNPVACAAGVASMALLREGDAFERIARIERFYAERLPTFVQHPRVRRVRWMGTIGVVELADGPASYYNAIGDRVRRAFLDRGYLIRPLGPVVYTMPPYETSMETLGGLYDAFVEILDTL